MTQNSKSNRIQKIDTIIGKYAFAAIYSHNSIEDEDHETKEAIAEEGSGMFTELPVLKEMIEQWVSNPRVESDLPLDKYIEWCAIENLLNEFLTEVL